MDANDTSLPAPWVAFYPPGVDAQLQANTCDTLAALCRASAARFGANTAFSTILPNGFHGHLSFQAVDALSDDFAVYLRAVLRLKPGDRVAVQMPNGLSYPVVVFGVFKAGCALVNVNPLYTAEEMGHQFSDAKPQALVIGDRFTGKLPRALADYAIGHLVLTGVADFFAPLPRLAVNLAQRLTGQVPFSPVKAVSISQALRKGRAQRRAARIDPNKSYAADIHGPSLACLQYTGGTTGTAKGAMLTHTNLVTNVAQAMAMLGAGRVRPGEEVVLTALPLYHIFAFTLNFLGFFWIGAHNVLVPSPRPIHNLRKAFEGFPISWITGVNTLFNSLNEAPWFAANPPRHLRAAVAGGMALQDAVAARWQQITGIAVTEGYGLTETSPIVSFNPFHRPKPGSIGLPLPHTLVRCVDEAGNAVPAGTPGELAVKGPQVMMGYWSRPQDTAQILKDGWLLTGDIATLDDEGYLRLVDRKKDMILHSGFNIYPTEVEECLVRHPGVVEAAVIGVPDGAAGEAVKAFVVRRDEGVSVEDLRAFCKDKLTPYKVPKFIEFRASLPKTPVGKILRKALRG